MCRSMLIYSIVITGTAVPDAFSLRIAVGINAGINVGVQPSLPRLCGYATIIGTAVPEVF